MSIHIKISGLKYECEMTLHERVTVIVGDSGRGKTVFAKAAQNRSRGYNVELSNPEYSIQLLELESWEAVLEKDITDARKRIYIIDDADYMYTHDFARVYKRVKGSYFIFITRLEAEAKFEDWNTIPFSAGEIYTFVAEGKKHYLTPLYNYPKLKDDEYTPELVDVCITEDSKSGYEFAQYLFKEVLTANGKDNIVNTLSQNRKCLRGKSVFFFMDFSAAGFGIKEVMDVARAYGIRSIFSRKIESLEYVFLKSNFFSVSDDEIFNDELLNFLSVERRCTELLEELSKGTQLAYTKAKLNECYVIKCCPKVGGRGRCTRGMRGDKLDTLLGGTAFEYLLRVRQVEGGSR